MTYTYTTLPQLYCINQDVIVRDNAVFQLIHIFNNIPIAILLGGGYHVSSTIIALQ